MTGCCYRSGRVYRCPHPVRHWWIQIGVCLLTSGSEAFNSPGVHAGEDKWGESYPQSGPNEKSVGDAHILSAKQNKTILPKALLNANWIVMQCLRHLVVSSFGQWFVSICHTILTFGSRSRNGSMCHWNLISQTPVLYSSHLSKPRSSLHLRLIPLLRGVSL